MKFKLISFGLCLILGLTITSCKKWITVTPKTQIENSLFFANRQGFVEGMNGVYIKLLGTNLYGREMTFGMVDILGKMYSVNTGTSVQRDLSNGLYFNTNPYDLISAAWNNQYNVIANINNLLEHLETADKNMFQEGEYDRIKGEALGLRAFLHFDMIRLYTKSYRDGGELSPGVPYVTIYSPGITPRRTVKYAMESVIADLKAAEESLKADPIITLATNTGATAAFELRKERFNYYAVKGTMARAYLWMLDGPNALAQAESVIGVAPKFPFTTQASLTQTNPNRTFSTEHLFGLTISSAQLQLNYARVLDSNTLSGTATLRITAAQRTEIFENSNTDFRNGANLIKDAGGSWGIYYTKLHQPSSVNPPRMPLMKIPEMYYIAAECLAATDGPKAVGYLNTVRVARGLTALSTTLNESTIRTEIYKEYRKEMPVEGQMFYYYKRINSSAMPIGGSAFPASLYVLPLPQQELDYGQ